MNGAGEMLVFSAADFEDFLEPRPDLQPVMEAGTEEGGPPAGGEPLAVPPARHLRRIHLPLSRRLRGGRPRDSLQRTALVLRPCRDHLRSNMERVQGPGRRHRHPGPDGLPGGILRGPLRQSGRRAYSAHHADAGDGDSGRRRHRRHRVSATTRGSPSTGW